MQEARDKNAKSTTGCDVINECCSNCTPLGSGGKCDTAAAAGFDTRASKAMAKTPVLRTECVELHRSHGFDELYRATETNKVEGSNTFSSTGIALVVAADNI